jgi:hypothetical protein
MGFSTRRPLCGAKGVSASFGSDSCAARGDTALRAWNLNVFHRNFKP